MKTFVPKHAPEKEAYFWKLHTFTAFHLDAWQNIHEELHIYRQCETQRLHSINVIKLIKSKDCRMIKSLFFFAWVLPFTLLDGDPTHFPS